MQPSATSQPPRHPSTAAVYPADADALPPPHPNPLPPLLRSRLAAAFPILLAAAFVAFTFVGFVLIIIAARADERALALAPTFALSFLSLSNVSISVSASSLSASFSASLLFAVPDPDLSLSYHSPFASVSLAASSPLAVASLPDFSTPPRNTTTLAVRLVADGGYVGPAAVLARGGVVGWFKVRVEATAVFVRRRCCTWSGVVTVVCDGVPVEFRAANATDAGFAGPPQPCVIYVQT